MFTQYNDSINVMLTVRNDTNRESFLAFLKEQLSLNGVVCELKKV